MSERYTPYGRQLTERELEILDHLIEEAAEVIQAASKLKRFGFEERDPVTEMNNLVKLSREVGNFSMMVEIAIQNDMLNKAEIDIGLERKLTQLSRFSKHLP